MNETQALSPASPDAVLRRTAAQHLEAGRIEEAAEVMRRLYADQVGRGLNIRVCRDSLLDPARKPGDPYVAMLSEVELDTGRWTPFDRERAYPVESYHRNFANSPLVRQRVSPNRDRYLVVWNPPSVTIEQPCTLLGSDDNYSHWVLRSLLKLWLVDRNPALRDLPWVVGTRITAFQREYLDLLGVSESRLLRVPNDAVVHFRSLCVPTQMLDNRGFADGANWLRGKLAPWMATLGEACELIYVARTDSSTRRLVNEEEVFAALAPLGFHRVALTGMPVRDQVATFSRARCIVTPHGAGLANLVFSPPGTRIVEILSSNILSMGDFRQVASRLGQRCEPVISGDFVMDEARRRDVPQMHWDYRVSVDAVRDAALKALA